MKKVCSGIYLITEKGAFGVIKPPLNIYVIPGENGLIYDAGYGKKKAIKYLTMKIQEIRTFYASKNKEFKLEWILPSHAHPDHFAGLKMIREKLDIKILLTKRMAEITKDKHSFYKSFEESHEDYYKIKKKEKLNAGEKIRIFLYRKFYKYGYGVEYISDPDEIIEEETVININNEAWKIFHSPGHAIDHISLYNEDRGILLAGDNILRSKTTWLGPPGSDIHDYINSLKQILDLPKLNIILPAHGSPIEQPKKRVEEILSHRSKRTKQVLNVIRENPDEGVTLIEIIHSLYPRISRFMRDVTRGWISLTLKMLEEEKLIKKEKSLKSREYIFFPTL